MGFNSEFKGLTTVYTCKLLRFKGIYNQVCGNYVEGDERELVICSGIVEMPRKMYQYGITQSQ